MRNLVIALALVASLGACAQVGADVGAVNTLATTVGDTELATCVQALGPLVGAKPAGAGLLYDLVAKYEGSKLFQPGGKCEGIAAEVAVLAVQHFGF